MVFLLQVTNSRHYVNENSQGQDYSDDLTEPPFVFARLNVGAIVRDLEQWNTSVRNVCFFMFFDDGETTHNQLEVRNDIHSKSDEEVELHTVQS